MIQQKDGEFSLPGLPELRQIIEIKCHVRATFSLKYRDKLITNSTAYHALVAMIG